MGDSIPEKSERKRGFATLSLERRRELARRGGVNAHRKGKAHEWTVEEARAAGRVGGLVSRGGRGKEE